MGRFLRTLLEFLHQTKPECDHQLFHSISPTSSTCPEERFHDLRRDPDASPKHHLWHTWQYPLQSYQDSHGFRSPRRHGKGHQIHIDRQTVIFIRLVHQTRNRSTYHTLQETSRPGKQHLSNTQPSSGVPIGLGEITLKDPNALTEPGYQLKIVRCSTQQCLCRVHVGRNQTRDDDTTGQVVFLFAWILLSQRICLSKVGDNIALDLDCAIVDDPTGWIDCNDSRVGVEHFVCNLGYEFTLVGCSVW